MDVEQPRIALRCYGAEHRAHAHDFHQLVLPLRGALALELGAQSAALAVGRSAWIAAGEVHGFAAIGDSRCLVLDAPCAAFQDFGSALAVRSAFLCSDPLLGGLAHECALGLAQGRSAAWARQAAGLLLLSLVETARPAQQWPKRLQRALDYIAEHFREALQVADIAAAACLSESRLHALFRQALGTTPLARVTALRLAEAQRLLAGGRCSLTQAAAACGYADADSLRRALRRAAAREA